MQLVSVCTAVCMASEADELLHLGIAPDEAVRIRPVAQKVLDRVDLLVTIPKRVAASPPLQAIVQELNSRADVRALDTLIRISSCLIDGHQELLQENLWWNQVFPRLRKQVEMGIPGIGESGQGVLRVFLTAFDSRESEVTALFRLSDERQANPPADGTGDFDALAVVLSRINFLRFSAGIRLGLDHLELRVFESWVSECAGVELQLPGSSLDEANQRE
jgi:hypothetical protein